MSQPSQIVRDQPHSSCRVTVKFDGQRDDIYRDAQQALDVMQMQAEEHSIAGGFFGPHQYEKGHTVFFFVGVTTDDAKWFFDLVRRVYPRAEVVYPSEFTVV